MYPICQLWREKTSEMGLLALITQSTAFAVVMINFLLRNIFIKLISLSKMGRYSKESNATMFSILLVSFFNYGILYIIAPWSLSESGASDGDFFSGIYTDFSSQWFLDIGILVTETTVLNIAGPLVEYLFFWFIRHLKRMYDQRSLCPCKRQNTNAKTIMQFEQIYSGPSFEAHYRLAFIVNIIFITFLFGAG